MTAPIEDEDLLRKFESLDLSADDFGHEEHLRLAWIMLRRLPLHEAVERYVGGIKRFAAHHGAPDRYHETITLFYLFEIDRRLRGRPQTESWRDFLRDNRDLAAPHRDFLGRHYAPGVLDSRVARRHFIAPSQR